MGAYTFTNCKAGFTISGTGTTRTIVATQSLTDFRPDRRISGNFLTNQQTGTASVTVKSMLDAGLPSRDSLVASQGHHASQ